MEGPSAGIVVVVVRHRVRQSCISRTVCPRINKFYTTLHTRRVYKTTGYDVTDYFRSEAAPKKKRRKCRLRWLQVEFLEKGLCEDHQICLTVIGQAFLEIFACSLRSIEQ